MRYGKIFAISVLVVLMIAVGVYGVVMIGGKEGGRDFSLRARYLWRTLLLKRNQGSLWSEPRRVKVLTLEDEREYWEIDGKVKEYMGERRILIVEGKERYYFIVDTTRVREDVNYFLEEDAREKGKWNEVVPTREGKSSLFSGALCRGDVVRVLFSGSPAAAIDVRGVALQQLRIILRSPLCIE